MKKYLFIIALVTSSIVSAQNKFASWEEFAQHNYANLESISYTLRHTIHFANGEVTSKTALVYADTANFYFDDKEDTALLHVKADSLWLIEYAYANITYGSSVLGTYGSLRDNFSWDIREVAPFYFKPGRTNLGYTLEEIKDTIIDDVPFSIMKFDRQIAYRYDNLTGRYNTPITDYVWLYCNGQTYWVDKAVLCNDECRGRIEVYEFKDISVSKKGDTVLSKYRMQNPKYNNYAKYDYSRECALSVRYWSYDDTLLSDKVLYFPLLNAHNDTVRLADSKGWMLIDFWDYGCASCVDFWTALQREQDSLGYRRLERDGIQLFCINSRGGVSGKFVDYAKRFHAQDILYSARGFNRLASRTTPIYYLFAPNHDLVYHGYSEHIIETLLDAKKKYEQEHSVKTKK